MKRLPKPTLRSLLFPKAMTTTGKQPNSNIGGPSSLDPAYATAHQWYGEYLSLLGRFQEALAESERARQLDPFSAIIATDHSAILLYSRNYDRAIEQAKAALEMEPNYSRAYSILVSAKIHQGNFAPALADVQKWNKVQPDQSAMAFEAYIYGRMGKPAKARRVLSRLKQSLRSSDGLNTAILPLAYTGMDQKDEAIRLLEENYSQHSNSVLGLKVDPFYDSLRSDPRFQGLLRKVRLAP
jgi:Cytochrome c biogenesis factor